MSKIKNITKMDYPDQSLHGYYVRLQRDGTRYARMFSVSKHGSMDEALAQAISYRDSIIERWQQYCAGKDETIQYQTTNTGFPGISLSESDGHPVFEVNLRKPDGKHIGKSLALPPKDARNYEQAFHEQFQKAKDLVNKYNRKRFGGRWYRYKQRKNIAD